MALRWWQWRRWHSGGGSGEGGTQVVAVEESALSSNGSMLVSIDLFGVVILLGLCVLLQGAFPEDDVGTLSGVVVESPTVLVYMHLGMTSEARVGIVYPWMDLRERLDPGNRHRAYLRNTFFKEVF